MPAPQDLSDQKFNRLTVLTLARIGTERAWLCRCDCGTIKPVRPYHLKSGRVRSCGCLLNEVLHSAEHAEFCAEIAKLPRSHGLSQTPVYAVWRAMIQRCTSPKAHDWRWYGAKGVTVCDRWLSFANFYVDMGEPNGLTLDRIDPFGNYEPENCRWTTWETQRANTRKRAA